jgi:hypothetical protein
MHSRATIMNAKVTGSEYGRESTLTLTLRRSSVVLCALCGSPSSPSVVPSPSSVLHSVFSVDPHRRRVLDRVPISRVRC